MIGLNEKFGKALREYRLKNGWTQEELAKRLHTSKQVISKYENSQRSPNIYVANEYARVLGVTLEEMLGVTQTEENPVINDRRAEQINRLTGVLDTLNENQLDLLISFLEQVIQKRE